MLGEACSATNSLTNAMFRSRKTLVVNLTALAVLQFGTSITSIGNIIFKYFIQVLELEVHVYQLIHTNILIPRKR